MKKLQVYKQEGCTTTVQKEKMSWLEFLKLQIILYSFSKSCDFLKLQDLLHSNTIQLSKTSSPKCVILKQWSCLMRQICILKMSINEFKLDPEKHTRSLNWIHAVLVCHLFRTFIPSLVLIALWILHLNNSYFTSA